MAGVEAAKTSRSTVHGRTMLVGRRRFFAAPMGRWMSFARRAAKQPAFLGEHLPVLLCLLGIEEIRNSLFHVLAYGLELGIRFAKNPLYICSPALHDHVGRLFLLRTQIELLGETVEQDLWHWTMPLWWPGSRFVE